jgi:diguanylate cyclase (GGDEF)-like protein
VWHSRSDRRVNCPRSAWRLTSGGLGLLCVLFMNCPAGAEIESPGQLLKRADSVRLSNHAEFTAIMQKIDSKALSPAQQDYFRYLKAWNSGYDGDYQVAIPTLKAVIAQSQDVTLQFRASASVVNELVLIKRYEEAFSRLGQLLELLPRLADPTAREQGQGVAALLYDQVGQYDLSLRYSQMMISESRTASGRCKGGLYKLWAQYESKRPPVTAADLQAGIDVCTQAHELLFANLIRTFSAKLYIDLGQFDDAIGLLKDHYDEVKRTRYPQLISAFDALLAEAYRKKGSPALARQFAFSTLDSSVKHEFTEQLATAYRLLYELAKEQGDLKSALAFHEKYGAADKAYLDDIGARRLAYDKAVHEAIANKLQIDALNKQNQVLHLQKALSGEAVENSRLYIALLVTIMLFIGLWAYRTKRSQLHFRSLSQLDGLTGICNRPHFMSLAEGALESCGKAQQDVCIVLYDLDQFKTINDRHGHATGDFALREAVSRCRVYLQANEVFGRFGGEEFSIVLPACGPEAARQRAEQLRTAIAGIVVGSEGIASKVSASFGIAAAGSSGYELRQMLAHADAALYQAKRAGRNRVVVYDGTMEVQRTAPITLEFDTVQLNEVAVRTATRRG